MIEDEDFIKIYNAAKKRTKVSDNAETDVQTIISLEMEIRYYRDKIKHMETLIDKTGSEMEQEEKVLKLLAECWNEFLKLDTQHPDEMRDYCNGIHRCQDIIGLRFARESRPDLFPIKQKTESEWQQDQKGNT